jgi:hypothetical protein
MSELDRGTDSASSTGCTPPTPPPAPRSSPSTAQPVSTCVFAPPRQAFCSYAAPTTPTAAASNSLATPTARIEPRSSSSSTPRSRPGTRPSRATLLIVRLRVCGPRPHRQGRYLGPGSNGANLVPDLPPALCRLSVLYRALSRAGFSEQARPELLATRPIRGRRGRCSVGGSATVTPRPICMAGPALTLRDVDPYGDNTVTFWVMLSGYRAAFDRFENARLSRDSAATFIPLFETLNWLVALDDQAAARWSPTGKPRGPEDAGGGGIGSTADTCKQSDTPVTGCALSVGGRSDAGRRRHVSDHLPTRLP